MKRNQLTLGVVIAICGFLVIVFSVAFSQGERDYMSGFEIATTIGMFLSLFAAIILYEAGKGRAIAQRDLKRNAVYQLVAQSNTKEGIFLLVLEPNNHQIVTVLLRQQLPDCTHFKVGENDQLIPWQVTEGSPVLAPHGAQA